MFVLSHHWLIFLTLIYWFNPIRTEHDWFYTTLHHLTLFTETFHCLKRDTVWASLFFSHIIYSCFFCFYTFLICTFMWNLPARWCRKQSSHSDGTVFILHKKFFTLIFTYWGILEAHKEYLGVGCLRTRCAKTRSTLKKDYLLIILPTYRVITRRRQQLRRGSEH